MTHTRNVADATATAAPEASAEAQDRIVSVMNHGWLCLLLSIGEQLGLHEVLAEHQGLACRELAEATGCDDRYLQEWLWGMVAGGIVVASDADEPTFSLADGYAPLLTRAGGPLHWSRITTQIATLATLEPALLGAIRTGGGLPAELYEGRVAEVLAGESGPIFERALLAEVLPLTGLTDRLRFGIDVIDLGCGTGTAAMLLAREFPHSRIRGVDQSRSALELARARAVELGLDNVEFLPADLEADFDFAPADLVMAANVVHDLSDPAGFFVRVRELLRPAGMVYLHELSATTRMRDNVTDPHALGILTFSLYHCLPLAKRRPGIAPGGMWGREHYVDALRRAGFESVSVHRVPSDPNNDTILAS
jgi:SAM-dependent methyltransferase